MAPTKKKTTKYPRRPTNPVNIYHSVFDILTEMADYEDRPIKTQLERIIMQEYQRFKKR